MRLRAVEGVQETGHPIERLANNLSLVVGGLDGASLVMALDLAGLACSTGSACVTGSTEPSHDSRRWAIRRTRRGGSLRRTLGRTTTADEIDEAGRLTARAIDTQREAAARLGTAVPATPSTGTTFVSHRR